MPLRLDGTEEMCINAAAGSGKSKIMKDYLAEPDGEEVLRIAGCGPAAKAQTDEHGASRTVHNLLGLGEEVVKSSFGATMQMCHGWTYGRTDIRITSRMASGRWRVDGRDCTACPRLSSNS